MVTDKGLSLGRPLSFIVRESILGGCKVVQYREKNFEYRTHFREALEIRDLCRQLGVLFIINDRVDLALALDACGVHLGQSDMPLSIARRILGPEKVIGLSLESPADLDSILASEDRNLPDYCALSPIFPTPTKTDTIGAWGIEGIREASSRISIPIVGIGGIHEGNLASLVESGLDSIAVVSSICSSQDPRSSTEKLSSILEESYRKRFEV